ncbi:MAG: hypothetical protein NUV51_06025 [Sulfuricaulis sp.]|nr:hypothetical protein [Sulfuricaulis sp.]
MILDRSHLTVLMLSLGRNRPTGLMLSPDRNPLTVVLRFVRSRLMGHLMHRLTGCLTVRMLSLGRNPLPVLRFARSHLMGHLTSRLAGHLTMWNLGWSHLAQGSLLPEVLP